MKDNMKWIMDRIEASLNLHENAIERDKQIVDKLADLESRIDLIERLHYGKE